MNIRITLSRAVFTWIVALAAPAWAQSSSAIGGYTLGYVFDGRSSDLKPMVGIPGAAVLGASLETGVAIQQAYVSPRQNYAVALTDSGAVVVPLPFAADTSAIAPLGFDASAAGVVALSPDGSAGAFYSVNEAAIRIVAGMPDSPAIARTISTAAISGTIRLLAIGNDAAMLVAAVDIPDTGSSVMQIDADGNGRTLTNSTHISALRFMGGGNDLLVADDADDTVSMIQDVPGSALWKPLAAATDGIAGPIGLDVSLDGMRIVVANGRAGNIFEFDPNGPERGTYPCPCAPKGLGRLNGNSVFLLNSVSDAGPLWIFDGDSATPRVLFIPAAVTGPASSAQ
jgi:hypothetical protein